MTVRRLKILARLGPQQSGPTHDGAFPKLFIIGAGRSGTTWVSELLGEHPAVVTEAESHAYNRVLRPLTERGASPATWTEILAHDDRMRRVRSNLFVQRYVDRRTLHRLVRTAIARRLPGPEAGDWLIDQVFAHFYAANGGDGRKLLVEKTPGHTIHARHILDHHPDARIVEVQRDGRDVSVSKHMRRVAQGRADQRWTAEQRDARFRHWARYIQIGIDLRADPRYAGRIHVIRYENLRENPAREIGSLLEFAGLDDDSQLVARMIDETAFGTRGRTGEGQHRRKGIVGDWRNYFTPEDEQAFEQVAGDVLEASGYALTRKA